MKKSQGFTLIELMLVVAIVGILSAVAVNMYTDNVIAANRTEGRSALQTAAGTLEKCKSLYGVYDDLVNCNYPDFQTVSGYYDIAVVRDNVTFTLTATRVAGSKQISDAKCGDLSLTNTGIQGSTGTRPPADCW